MGNKFSGLTIRVMEGEHQDYDVANLQIHICLIDERSNGAGVILRERDNSLHDMSKIIGSYSKISSPIHNAKYSKYLEN